MSGSGGIVQGRRDGAHKSIDSVVRGDGKEALAVDATVSAVVDNAIDHADDDILVYGAEGGNPAATHQALNVDSSGRPRVMGAAADGAVLTGIDPVLIAAQDGSNIQSILADSLGRIQIVGAAAQGAAGSGNPVRIAGAESGGNIRTLLTNSTGTLAVGQQTAVIALGDTTGNNIFAPTDVSANVQSNRNFNMVFNGSTWDRMRGNTSGMGVNGGIAHDGADTSNPVNQGGHAISHNATPTEVAAGDITRWYFNRAGVPFVMGGHPNIQTREYRWDTAQTDDDVLGGAPAGGRNIVVTRVTLTVDEATTVGVKVRLGFGNVSVPAEPSDGNSVAGIILSHSGVVPGGGITIGDGSGMLGVGASGEELRITAEAPTSGSARLCITYYEIVA